MVIGFSGVMSLSTVSTTPTGNQYNTRQVPFFNHLVEKHCYAALLKLKIAKALDKYLFAANVQLSINGPLLWIKTK